MIESKVLRSLIDTGALGSPAVITALIESGHVSESTVIETASKTGAFNLREYIRELQANIAEMVRTADLSDRGAVESLKHDFNTAIREIRDLLPEAVAVEMYEVQPQPVILG
jgi:DNA-binding MurR/RpiR family transcriptional regulator